MPLSIRDATAADFLAIRALTLRAYAEYGRSMAPSAWAGLERALHAALESSDAERILAEYEGVLVGSVMLSPPATETYGGEARPVDWPELRLLAVAPEARGLGVGRALVRECVRRAQRMGASTLGLHTSASMRTAMRLYEHMGFVRAPEDDFQPDGAERVEGYRLALRGLVADEL